MRLRQIRILLAIAENGLNITAAAEKLFTSQPGVSKQLKLLEEELQLKIFSRKGKSLEAITPEGEEVIRRAENIMREVEAIQSLSQRLFEDEEGALPIATSHTQARSVLPEVIAAFRERYPKIRVDLHQGTSEQIASMAAARQVDFAKMRAIADMVLSRSESSRRRFYSMSAQIRRERKEYYATLESTQKGDVNVTQWQTWFLGCLLRAVEGAHETLGSVLTRCTATRTH